MHWNLDKIRFLHPPDDFVGTFSNELMQKRHKAMQEKKLQEIHSALAGEERAVEAMNVLNKTEHIQFVHNNQKAFRKDGTLEHTVLNLYYHQNTPFAPAGKLEEWTSLLELCDRASLLKLGQPFPESGKTAYRGSLIGKNHGLSWTTDVKEARWILNRWQDKDQGGGTVYSATIRPADILSYIVDDKRQEVLLKPERMLSIEGEIITSA